MPEKYAPKTDIKVIIDKSAKESLLNDFQEESCTIVHCCTVGKTKYINGGWVNIHPTTILNKTDSFLEELPMLHAINIPMAPAKHYFKQQGDVKRFTLYFPAIPKDWTIFSLIELTDKGHGFTSHNLTRNQTGIYELFF